MPWHAPDDEHAVRVTDVLRRATALSDELQRTIAELTEVLHTEGDGEDSAERSE